MNGGLAVKTDFILEEHVLNMQDACNGTHIVLFHKATTPQKQIQVLLSRQ